MKEILFIFLGGGLGSILRFFIGRLLNANFPFGTLIVNVVGAFIIGISIALLEKQWPSKSIQLFITVGFCGGFTTWSSFAFENFTFLRQGNILYFLLYAGVSFLLSLVVIFIAYKCVKS